MRESPEEAHARKAALIAGIASGKMVIEAAAESGIGWRRAYVWRAEDAAFRAAWDRDRAQIKARVPAALAVPPPPDPPAPPPAFVVPPSPPLPPEISKEQKAIVRLRRFNADGTWRHEDDPPGYVRAPESDDD
ncbi:MAG: hypothetical protein FJX55_19295 [Alphaproteobacteria bacterium]|nr:hypothetical protein [Alphaproteobacteria bacterium]